MTYTYRAGCVVRFGDIDFAADAFRIAWQSPYAHGLPRAPPLPVLRGFDVGSSYEARITMRVPRSALERLLAALERKTPRPRFALAFATLMRRAGYGGRKGRRALQRLHARPDSEWKQWAEQAGGGP